jgi:hypothetical protein
MVIVDVNNFNVLQFRESAAGLDLLLDGDIPLRVAGVTGINDGFS